jgi:hypothetical protein
LTKNNVVLPGDFGTKATRIDGDPTAAVTASGRFGYNVLGLGRFYGSAKNTALVVAEPYYGLNTTTVDVGKLYSFRLDEGLTNKTPGSIALSKARHTTTGLEASINMGATPLVMLGNLGPQGASGVGFTYPRTGKYSYAEMRSGTAIAGPFAQQQLITTTETSTNREFARFFSGGGISGSSEVYSLIGSDTADLVVSTQANASYRLFVIDGTKITMSGTSDVAALADVTIALDPPTGEGGTTVVELARKVVTVGDTNGDGYPDIAVGYVSYGSPLANGRVLVYY